MVNLKPKSRALTLNTSMDWEYIYKKLNRFLGYEAFCAKGEASYIWNKFYRKMELCCYHEQGKLWFFVVVTSRLKLKADFSKMPAMGEMTITGKK